MSNKSMVADVADFEKLTMAKMVKVARQSIQETLNTAQTPVAKGGAMPVDTGALRNSLVSRISTGTASAGADSFMVVIAQLKLGDVINFAWTADYAVPRHYMVGVGQGGGLWRDLAVQNWQAVVRKNASAVR
jgi:hypothetical protein